MVVFPNAKINIGLSVIARRPDGFHNLETVFYPIGLSDILEIGELEAEPGEYTFRNTGLDVKCEPEKNLTVKAYRLLAEDNRLPAVQIHLHKIITYGAGLGGGSSDAAFMLKALNTYFDLQLSEERLLDYATRLGSDCSFFIRNQPVFASGKGEILQETDLSLKGYRIVLVKPDFGVSTPEAYAGIQIRPAAFDLRSLYHLPIAEWKEKVNNDFEQTVFRKYPFLADLKQALYEEGAEYAAMTGSGSAVYGLFAGNKGEDFLYPDCFVWKGKL